MSMIRIKDIAEKAGVSATTVSNVIHGNTKKVSAGKIDTIQRLLKEASYVPSMGARMLAEKRSRVIGVLVGGKADKRKNITGDAFSNLIIRALEQEIYKRNYFMLLHVSGSTEENLQLAATWNVEGLITIGISAQDNRRMQSRCQAPLVSIDVYYEDERVANVGLDDEKGGYDMAKFLLEQGHRDILFLSDNDVGVDHARWQGVQRALKEAGIEADNDRHVMFAERAEQRLAYYTENWEKLISRDALFFASDFYAMEAVVHMKDRGIRIPEEISVAGFDDSEYALLCRPGLTTIHQEVENKGKAAVEKLFAFIEGEKQISMNQKLPVRLVVRDSVRKKDGCKVTEQL